jgi:hypothetical protein
MQIYRYFDNNSYAISVSLSKLFRNPEKGSKISLLTQPYAVCFNLSDIK